MIKKTMGDYAEQLAEEFNITPKEAKKVLENWLHIVCSQLDNGMEVQSFSKKKENVWLFFRPCSEKERIMNIRRMVEKKERIKGYIQWLKQVRK